MAPPMPLLADAATTAAPVLLIGAAVAGMAYHSLRARGQRARFSRRREGGMMTGEPGRVGSSLSLKDAGLMSQGALRGSLRVTTDTALDDDGNDDFVTPLGLKLIRGSSGSAGAPRPQVMHGTRHGHQVFVRQGMVGDALTPGLGQRKFRDMTVVRVAAPAFEWTADDGRLEPGETAPDEVRTLFAGLARSPDVWRNLRGVAGADGIAVSRQGTDAGVSGWMYDLWLLERLGAELGWPALARVRLNSEWKLPYGLTDWKPAPRLSLS